MILRLKGLLRSGLQSLNLRISSRPKFEEEDERARVNEMSVDIPADLAHRLARTAPIKIEFPLVALRFFICDIYVC
ncbi:hypothetical protein HZH66_012948 [Vespula vulgaris]|uniref:Uncharacterized protein n=1 Tax=Vespula vulgaris TaxID=7454 RepID=A0A834MUM5_VESVU|nr:hypothetical protein HZH66_012948 [Vespula vulgaris]